ncbi:hypothetical protein AAMO2058_001417500 [Amorphochlora amoebiformis]
MVREINSSQVPPREVNQSSVPIDQLSLSQPQLSQNTHTSPTGRHEIQSFSRRHRSPDVSNFLFGSNIQSEEKRFTPKFTGKGEAERTAVAGANNTVTLQEQSVSCK